MRKLENEDIDELYKRIVELIENSKLNVAIKVNNEMTFLYWNIGKDITENILNNEKAEYGKSIIKNLSNKLTIEYGRGYSVPNMFRMVRFYNYFNNFEILSTLSIKLSWSHFVELLQIDDKIKREFYYTMCINENWSVRTLRDRISSALFERTKISKNSEQTILNDLKLLNKENKMTTNLFFRDPYILDFLDLKDTYSEKAEGEEKPIAIILCASKSNMIAQLLELDNSGIHVAQYLTKYVPKEILEKKLLDSIEKAKIKLKK